MSRWLRVAENWHTYDPRDNCAYGKYLFCTYTIDFNFNKIRLTVPYENLTEKVTKYKKAEHGNRSQIFSIGDFYNIQPRPSNVSGYFKKDYNYEDASSAYFTLDYVGNQELFIYEYKEIIEKLVNELISNGYIKNL